MNQTIVIGAGPGGLSAAYLLAKRGMPVTVLEQDPVRVGGLSCTVVYKGYRFDIGGHRFFSKSAEIEALWTEILGAEMMVCRRLSRIYYQQRFFDYPIRPLDAFVKLGIPYTALCLFSYFKARILPRSEVKSFEDWVINQFGERLYRTFFKTYTEKVWGLSCDQISADWAAQRIKGLSMLSLLRNMVFPQRSGDRVIKTLIDQFRYPRLGPGQMWEQVQALLQAQGHSVLLDQKVVQIRWQDQGVYAIQTRCSDGSERLFSGAQFLSTMPLRSLLDSLDPSPPEQILAAAAQLKYRDFLTVALIIDQPDLFPDNWIYIHDPSVQVGRIQNFKNWSADLVADPKMTCLGLEYFCFEHNDLWRMPDTDLIALAERELDKLGLLGKASVVDGAVVRAPKAYPVYDQDYQHHIHTIREFLEKNLPNLQLVGRNGMHRYNNQDHAMMTGLLAAQNILLGEQKYDLWRVNQDAVYLEEDRSGSETNGRLVPNQIS